MKTKNFFTKSLRSLRNEDKFTCSLFAMWTFLIAFAGYQAKGHLEIRECIWMTLAALYAVVAIYIDDNSSKYENKKEDNSI